MLITIALINIFFQIPTSRIDIWHIDFQQNIKTGRKSMSNNDLLNVENFARSSNLQNRVSFVYHQISCTFTLYPSCSQYCEATFNAPVHPHVCTGTRRLW